MFKEAEISYTTEREEAKSLGFHFYEYRWYTVTNQKGGDGMGIYCRNYAEFAQLLCFWSIGDWWYAPARKDYV